ncbi:hypothetical protein ASU31_04260 [Pedobacter ginsenosidimutans]|uniref:Uncharacterized protein n=1 Tax=Pedobacter ginsenosidimutans TaxID=687842 RepID=A0A0T5VTC8_9SPHI|nr:hypothetical protein ASU31_04260 [Pedobacter ginsenosidimutans]
MEDAKHFFGNECQFSIGGSSPAIRFNLFESSAFVIVIARRNDAAIFYCKCKQKGFLLLSGLGRSGWGVNQFSDSCI